MTSHSDIDQFKTPHLKHTYAHHAILFDDATTDLEYLGMSVTKIKNGVCGEGFVFGDTHAGTHTRSNRWRSSLQVHKAQ